MMENFTPSPWSNGLTTMTIIGSVIIIGIIAYMCFHYSTHSKYLAYTIPCAVTIAVLIAVVLVCVALMPRGVSRTEKGITVHLLAKNIVIPADEIEDIETYPIEEKTVRVFGAGGFLGYIGLFNNEKIGDFDCFATDFKKSYVIRRKNKRPIVVTVENSDVLKQ